MDGIGQKQEENVFIIFSVCVTTNQLKRPWQQKNHRNEQKTFMTKIMMTCFSF